MHAKLIVKRNDYIVPMISWCALVVLEERKVVVHCKKPSPREAISSFTLLLFCVKD